MRGSDNMRKIIEAMEISEASKFVLTQDSIIEGKTLRDKMKKYGSGTYKGDTYVYLEEPYDDVSVDDQKYQWDYMETIAVKLGEEIKNGKANTYLVLFEHKGKLDYVEEYSTIPVK